MNLSKEQLVPINSSALNKLVLAGPGTGKSTTILGYIYDLVNNKKIPPESILILTFTRTICAELKKKIKELLKDSPEIPRIYTLHGFALRQLLKNVNRIQMLPNNFIIADDFEERHIILEDLKAMLKMDKIRDVKDLLNQMASNWETLNADSENWEQNFVNPEFIGAWQEHRSIFGYVLRSELVYQFKNILESGENLNLDEPFDYLIVDEYQDLNKCDLRVIENLNKRGAKLFCAGDDDQSIYGFRFAYPEGIRNFTKDIKDSEQFPITECYRCDENILNIALNVIRQDFRRIPKKLNSITGLNGETHLLHFLNQNEEAAKISELIDTMIKNKITTENEIIILMRSDFHHVFSDVIKDSLLEKGIKLNSKKSIYNVFESNVGRFFISIVKLFDNKENDLALRDILLLTKGIGEVTISGIYNRARVDKTRFYNILNNIVEGKNEDIRNSDLVKEKMSIIFQLVDELKNSNDSLIEISKKILSICELDVAAFTSDLINLINDLELKTISDLNAVIIDLFGPSEPIEEIADGVRIMSMHQAKGLTADVVFIIAAEDEYLPGRGSVDEERRLFYVSLTRARHLLLVSYCSRRIGRQSHTGYLTRKTTNRTLTRYLRNLPILNTQDGNNFNLKLS